jgi:hypothetical protein
MSFNRPISITVYCHVADTWVLMGVAVKPGICPLLDFFERKLKKDEKQNYYNGLCWGMKGRKLAGT